MSVYYIDYQNPNYEEAVAAYNSGRPLVVTNCTGTDGYPIDSYHIFQCNEHYTNESYPSLNRFGFLGIEYGGACGYFEVMIQMHYSIGKMTCGCKPIRHYLNTKIGGTMEAPLLLSGEPTEDLEAATKGYVDTSIANLVNSAPETLDTLGELATAFEENQDVVEALDAAISNKQDKNLVITATSTTADDGTKLFSVDKTFEEITEAYNNGTNVNLYYNGGMYDLNKIIDTNAWFNYYVPNTMGYNTIKIASDNTVTFTSKGIIATAYSYGGVKASAKSETDTVETKIGDDGKLYVPEYPVTDTEISAESTNPVQNKVVKEYVDEKIATIP